MDFNKLQTLIKINTSLPRWNRGVIYYNKKLVDSASYNLDKNIFNIKGIVESEYGNEVYQNNMSIDTINYKILDAKCSCEDFKLNDSQKLFICKHMVASSILAIKNLKLDFINSSIKDISKNDKSTLNISKPKGVLDFFSDLDKERVHFDVNINIDLEGIFADFKIGTSQMYVIKNLKTFVKSLDEIIYFGKNFIYNPKIHYFDETDNNLLNLIKFFINLDTKSNFKHLNLGDFGLKTFLETLKDKEFSLNYMGDTVYPQVIKGNLPIEFELKKSDDKMIFKSNSTLPIPLTKGANVVFYENDIYLLSETDAIYYKELFNLLENSKELIFNKEDFKDVFNHLIPKIKNISSFINLDEEIEDNIVSDFKVEFYFDLKNNNITCEIKFIYDDEDSQKYIFPDINREKYFEKILLDSHFIKEFSYFSFNGNDENLFEFFNEKLDYIKTLGDIYYSSKFKNKKIYNSSSIKASFKQGIGNYLEFDFEIEDIQKREYREILKAFNEKRTFYKLKNGNFIDLTEDKTKNFLQLVDNLDTNSKVHSSKMLYINDMIKSHNLNFIKGQDFIKEICENFKTLNSIDTKVSKKITAKLRGYQLDSLQWFNTLSHYQFGGILADEMGLGKTLQTISFLASKENSRSLIITPTSLIYNWKNEFDTFAPSMKVLLIHGNKNDREIALNSINNYDVIITTYATLRNDFDYYKDICFDYCIIDEAQNIKNPVALTTSSVKNINAKVRFALTGTPIENNLLELWSIFDFIMPGYLYSKTKFTKLFIKNEENASNLKKLIKPFILRRTKKEVMMELPDKIEKKFFVDLDDFERELYSSYVDDILNKMNNHDFKKDKITILSYLTKLRQICLDPSLVLENYNNQSSKIKACLDIIKEGIDEGHKILLFSQFTTVLNNLGKYLSENNISYSYIDGKTPAKERIDLVNEFNTTNKNKVFLISLKSGGVGLNLTSADVVIHFDPWWNPSVENQASDRAHRFGQQNVVEVIKLIAKGTIEEKIITLQETKKELIDEFINGDLASQNILKSLSDKEIIELFN